MWWEKNAAGQLRAILHMPGNNVEHVQQMTKSGTFEKYGALPCQHSPADLHVHCRNSQDWQMYCAICPSPAWRSPINVESSHFIPTELPFEKRSYIWEELVTSGRQGWEVSYLHFSDGVLRHRGDKKITLKTIKKPCVAVEQVYWEQD